MREGKLRIVMKAVHSRTGRALLLSFAGGEVAELTRVYSLRRNKTTSLRENKEFFITPHFECKAQFSFKRKMKTLNVTTLHHTHEIMNSER